MKFSFSQFPSADSCSISVASACFLGSFVKIPSTSVTNRT
jgi:hypothetical protein